MESQHFNSVRLNVLPSSSAPIVVLLVLEFCNQTYTRIEICIEHGLQVGAILVQAFG